MANLTQPFHRKENRSIYEFTKFTAWQETSIVNEYV